MFKGPAEDWEYDLVSALARIIVFLDQELCALRRTRRTPRRQYLLPAVLSNPRHMSSWSLMYEQLNENTLVTMGVNTAIFQSTLEEGFEHR
jgi:hypothetical protein